MRSCRGRGSSGSWQRKQEAKARGEAVMRPVGRPCIRLLLSCLLLLSQPLNALPLGHPHRVGEDGMWVREGCFSDLREAHMQALTDKSISLCSQWSVCPAAAAAALHRQQQPAVGGSRIHKLIPDRTLAKSL